jgi:hypothetical protein
MATIAELVAKLSLDNSKFNKGIDDSKEKLDGLGDEAKQTGKKTKEGFDEGQRASGQFGKAVSSLKGIIGAAFAADAIIGFGKNIINTTAEFQKMEAVLTNTLGSKSAAQVAMNRIVDFASKTPFEVAELTEAFVKLSNRGFVPTVEQMRSLGDIASSTGKSFDQLTEAALDAMTGEFERLKEFGIRASAEGDRVQFTFKGVTTEVEKTDSAIKDYILSLGDAEGVTGAMAAISETTGGKISNLGDNFTQLYKALGDSSSGLIAGILDVSNAFVNHLVKAIDSVNTIAAKTGQSGFKSFMQQLWSLVNPVYAKQLEMVATGIKAIDEAENAHLLTNKEQEKQTKAITEAEIKLADQRKKAHNERIKQLRKEEQEFLKVAKTLGGGRNAFALPEDKFSEDQIKKIAELSKKIFNPITSGLKLMLPPDTQDRLQKASELSAELTEQQAQFNKEMSIAATLTGMLGSTFQSAFEGMLNTGKVSFRGIIDGLKALIIRLIAAAAAAFALAAILGGLGLGSFTLSGGGFLKGFKELFSSMSGIPKFAKGGMVNGLTMAVLGDNPSGKEAVIPFEKMGSFLSQYGTGGNQNMRVEVVGRLQGEDIYFSGLNYSNKRSKIIGG